MLTKRTLGSIGALACGLALAGCGGGGSSTAGSATTTAVVATPTVTTPTPTPTITTPASVTAVLNVDFNAVPNYSAPTLPAYYDATVTALDNTPASNAASDKIALLGRVLFNDRKLSINEAISCASCHQQALGFDDDERFSTGFAGGAFTAAHAMRLLNVRYYRPGSMFWNKRAASLEAQASQPIINPVEMGWDTAAGGITALVARLQATSYYPDLFTFAFGSSTITETRIQQALAQFQRAMISSNSRWDTAYAQVFSATAPGRALNVTLPGFTDQENRGRQLFMTGVNAGGAGCSACHVPPTFALAANSDSNGLDAGETVIFKSPSLKSVGQSRFFMHDGRFATLDQVVEHYNSGVQAGPALDNRLRGPGGAPQRLNLSAADKAALVAFMQTLTDPQIAADARFTDPFKR
ncbi:MAG: cytochrome c peroxidase [Sphingomonadales bacterium]